MKNQRNSLGSPSVRKHLSSPSDPPLLHSKSRKESLYKPRTSHHSPKLSNTLVRVKSGEWSKPKEKSKNEFSRGKALEVLLEEDLKSAKKLGLRNEVAAIRRGMQAVMDRTQEFRGVLEIIQQRYEDIIEKAVAEAEAAQLALHKHQEEMKLLVKRTDVYERTAAKGETSPKCHTKETRTMPSSPKNAAANYESTERMNPWGLGKPKHCHKESTSSLPSYSDSPNPLKPFSKPQFVPRLRLDLLQKPQQSPKGQRDAIYIEDM